MTIPYAEPLVPRPPAARVLPEPPRRGEPGGQPCGVCNGHAVAAVWSDEHWSVHPPVGGSLPGTVWMAARQHVDSFTDAAGGGARSRKPSMSARSVCSGTRPSRYYSVRAISDPPRRPAH